MNNTLNVPTAPLVSPRAAQHSRFTPAEIAHYRTEGYVIAPNLFTVQEVERARETIREMTRVALASDDYSKVMELEPEKVDGESVPRRIYDPFLAHETFRSMGVDARMLDRLEGLVGPDICCNLSKLNMKPAKVGSVVDWHQDQTYYPHTNDDLVTVLVYLDDTTIENGCLQVIPRHQHAYFSHSDAKGNFSGLITEDLDSGKFGKPIPLEAPAGSVIFMHCILPHSSMQNRSPKSRRTLIYSFRAADSYPIYYNESVVDFEKKVRLVRGKMSPTARFGGPSPIIPQTKGAMKSLYEVQLAAKGQ
jgi:hypothetical protein